MSMKELKKSFGIAQSTVAGIVSRLEQKGFVEAGMQPISGSSGFISLRQEKNAARSPLTIRKKPKRGS